MTAPIAIVHDPQSSTRWGAAYFSKMGTGGLRAIRSAVDQVLDDRGRQFDLFCEREAAQEDAADAMKEFGAVLSPSQTRCWMDCQARWYFKYVLGLAEDTDNHRALGRAVHKALEGNFRQKMTTHVDLPTEQVETLFEQAWQAERAGKWEPWENANEDRLEALGRALVIKYMEEAAPAIQPAAVEQEVFGEIAGVRVRGYIDLLDVEGRIIDIKTSSRKPAAVKPDYAFQVATYRQITPTASGRARIDTLVKTKVPQLVHVQYEVSEADLRMTERLYPLAQEGMRSGIYYPNRLSMFCSRASCSFATRCEDEFGGVVH